MILWDTFRPKFMDGTDATEYQAATAPIIRAAAEGDPGEDMEESVLRETRSQEFDPVREIDQRI